MNPTLISILCVDDEPRVLDGLKLTLRRGFNVATATSGAEGLAVPQHMDEAAVVISDMRMPGMNGAAFLAKVRTLWPDSTRLLLTGEPGRDVAVGAVNEGPIFRRLGVDLHGATRLGLSPAASDHLFRIAQEAITNALKHAHANSIKVTLDIAPASVRLEICDDGEGLTLPEISATGLGLRTMSYRASLLGAKFHITCLDHAGTCVVCECPQAA